MMLKLKINQNSAGSMLISLMIFVVISLTIVTAAVLLVVDNTVTSSNQQIGASALSVAESGAENALLRLLRDPSYTGEVITVGDGQAAITVTGSNPLVITSVGTVSTFQRTVQVSATRVNGVLTVTSWNEI